MGSTVAPCGALLELLGSWRTLSARGLSKAELIEAFGAIIGLGLAHLTDDAKHLSQDLGWRNINRLEAGVGLRRFVDVLLEVPQPDGTVKLVYREMKALAEGSPFRFAAQVRKDVKRAIDRAKEAVETGKNFSAALSEELRSLEYVFRGSPQGMTPIITMMRAEIATALAGTDLAPDLARLVKFDFLYRSVPY